MASNSGGLSWASLRITRNSFPLELVKLFCKRNKYFMKNVDVTGLRCNGTFFAFFNQILEKNPAIFDEEVKKVG